MPGWRITAFDRASARGACTSGVGTLPFDASVARVDDFEIGEEVDVGLRPTDGGFVVTSIAPTRWRAPFWAPPSAVTSRLDAIAAAIVGRGAQVLGLDEDALRLRVDDDTYRPERILSFVGCCFVQITPTIELIASLRAFTPEDVRRAAPELVRHWPVIPDAATVFRIEPERFDERAAYVAALDVSLTTSER